MVSESALLLLTEVSCKSHPLRSCVFVAVLLRCLQRRSLAHQGGVLTPAAAFGTTLAARLSEHGLRFETSILDHAAQAALWSNG